MHTRNLLLPALLLLTACGDLLYIEAETESICKTESGAAFPAAPPVSHTVSQSLRLPINGIGDAVPEEDFEAELSLRSFELILGTGAANLDGIDSLSLTANTPGGTGAGILLGSYTRPAGQTNIRSIRLTGSEGTDIVSLARQDELDVRVDLSGMLPQEDWTADLDVCAGLRVRANYFNLVQDNAP
jgi:hypothetical protein